MNAIAHELARSIKEGKWVYIEYNNRNEAKTSYFWIAILDVLVPQKKLVVHMFNQEKSLQVLDGVLYFDQISKAEIIEGSTCDIQENLIHKIIDQPLDYQFLQYSGINDRILQYYCECFQKDKDGIIQKYNLVKGIDQQILDGTEFELSNKQYEEFVFNLKQHLKVKQKKHKPEIIKMAINVLAITSNRGLFPIVYRDLLLDIKKQTLVVSDDLQFNLKIMAQDENLAFDLARYIDGDLRMFMQNFNEQKEVYIEEMNTNRKRGEMIDELPYVFKMHIPVAFNIKLEYARIKEHFYHDTLTGPLRSFFGLNEKERKRKSKHLFVNTNQINMDQLRVLHSALNQDVTYVQGPPGTGKTATILNVITSCLFNDMSTLIVSNNNEAINNIQRKCESFVHHGILVPFPILRLGSNQSIQTTLQKINLHLSYYESLAFQFDDKELKRLEKYFINQLTPLQKAITKYEESSEVVEQIESLDEVIKTITSESAIDEISKNMAILGIRSQMDQLKKRLSHAVEQDVLDKYDFDPEKVMSYLFQKSLSYLHRLFSEDAQPLLGILHIRDEIERLQSFRSLLNDQQGIKIILSCFPMIISTNVSCVKLNTADPHFDLLIMDEASQCNNAVALLAVARAKRALFVGDQNQLQPVIVLTPEQNALLMKNYDIPSAYDYKHNSILSSLLKIDTLSKFILLREHYRCNHKIIDFSNQKYYGGELKLKSTLQNVDALKLIEVSSSSHNQKNTSMEEVEVLLQEIKLSETEDVAVITPFRRQADLIERVLHEAHLDHVKVGTVHTFQGDEKTKIILCSGISQNTQYGTFEWLKNNQELINVATTRAREQLVLICDSERVDELSRDESNDFQDLVHYIKKDGEVQIASKENELFDSKVKNFKYYNTFAEEEFLKTMLHLKSVYGRIKVVSKVKVSDVLELDYDDHELFTYGNQAHFDFVIYNLAKQPLCAIEVMGIEHFSDELVKRRDEKKAAIAKKHNISLVSIRNDYVRRYSFIKQTIMKALK